MYLYGKEHDLIRYYFDVEDPQNKLCDACAKAEDKRQQAECIKNHCNGANTNRAK